MTLSLSFAAGKCGALYDFDPAYGLACQPLVCTRKPGHEPPHEDYAAKNELHDGVPNWTEDTP